MILCSKVRALILLILLKLQMFLCFFFSLSCTFHLEAVAEIQFVNDNGNCNQGILAQLERLSTVDLPIKVAGLVKKVNDIFNLK
jgi:hypothetical protein